MKSRGKNTDSLRQQYIGIRLTKMLPALLLTLLTGIGIGLIPFIFSKEKFAHIDSEEVFNSFRLTQEYQSRIANLGESRKKILTNFELRLQDMEARKASTDSIQFVYEQYRQKKEAFVLDEQKELQHYNDQILTQLNQYIQEYCQEKGYSYVFGMGEADGLLGAAPEQEVTEEIITFINQKYLGEG